MPDLLRVAVLFAVLAGSHIQAKSSGDNAVHGPAWLNDGSSPRTKRWIATETGKTLAALRADPRFVSLKADAESVLTDQGRIDDVEFIGSAAYQYRQDHDHPLGVWRRSERTAWLAGTPQWETVIDLDALAAAEHRKWIFAGSSCRRQRCLIRLSINGQDANETREFDLGTRKFVAGGFVIPNSKSRSWWYDDDTLLVAPVLGPASVNRSQLPKTLRLWARGTPLSATRPVFGIGDEDAMLSAQFIKAAGTQGFVAARHIDFERREYSFIVPGGVTRALPLPPYATILGVFDGRLLLRPNTDWNPVGVGQRFVAGSIVGFSLDALLKDARIADAESLYVPAGDDAVREVTSADGRLFVQLLHDYRSRIVELSKTDGTWSARQLPLPADRFINIIGTDAGLLLLRVEAPLVPESIVRADPKTGASTILYQRPPAFDATGLTAELRYTASRDGTPIAYTLVSRAGMKHDGSNPTLIYGYGGYDVAITPRYEPVFGKLWLERGGVYVHAYLRGGGEHGPAWHRGSMRKNRRQPYDDMVAVLADVQRQGITTPQHSGILGRSNGGLMVAAVMEQAPTLMNAVIVGGPLIDMLDYHDLPPGGTWTAEYGDPRDPDMRPFLASYSPMQNIAPATTRYPVPLIITSSDDDRVLPGHARRFAALLSENGHASRYFEDAQGGHYWELAGGPAPGDWRLRSVARAVEFTYLWQQLGSGK